VLGRQAREVFATFVLFSFTAVGATAPSSANLDLGNEVILELVQIPAGDFVAGESHLNRSDIGFFSPYELIARKVTIAKPFYAGKYLVTVDQFARFVESTHYVTDAESGRRPWKTLSKGAYTTTAEGWGPSTDANWRKPGFPQDGTHPVTCISSYDADAFCRWASKQSGRKVRLPTEAELEYLQRAGTETRYFWGDRTDPHGRLANVADDGIIGDEDIFPDGQPSMKHLIPKGRNDQYPFTTPVGFFPPNLFGVFDAIGNVWEYTADWEGPNSARIDPKGPASSPFRSMKGGSWISTPDFYRPSIRLKIEPESRTSTRGLRVVVEE